MKPKQKTFFDIISERCDNGCVICGRGNQLLLHRIVPDGNDDVTNWVILCRYCKNKIDESGVRDMEKFSKIMLRGSIERHDLFDNINRPKWHKTVYGGGFANTRHEDE